MKTVFFTPVDYTCHATLDFAKEIESVLDSNDAAVTVFMDLSKAFDTVDKSILCKNCIGSVYVA